MTDFIDQVEDVIGFVEEGNFVDMLKYKRSHITSKSLVRILNIFEKDYLYELRDEE